MIPLIDADILRYEIGSVGQFIDEDGELQIRSWQFVQSQLEQTIDRICKSVGATSEPILFLTGDKSLNSKRLGRPFPLHIPNFREEVAVTKPYKGTRHNEKPFHYNNLTVHMIGTYNCCVSNGMEADDELAIYQTYTDNTIICSRDKDLRMVPGMHYGWKCGKQEEFGPYRYDSFGEIEYDKAKNKIVGGGFLFFCSQLITGDTVDNIPGLPRKGPAKAMQILEGVVDEDGAFKAVREAYREVMGDSYLPYLEEQVDLLWMIRDTTAEGEPIRFNFHE